MKSKMIEGKIPIMRVQVAFGSIIIAIVLFAAVGCGGGGSSSSDSSLQTGTFIDSPVQGLNYHSETQSGITDKDGHFMYQEDEMMTFSIGDVVLGQAMPHEVMTPMDFINSSGTPLDLTNPVVTNMGRFLQSLDADGNPENGIMISQDVRDEVNGRMIDFHQSIMDFGNDPDVVACFDVLNGLNIQHSGMMWGLVTLESAQQHMRDHMGAYIGGSSGNISTGSETGSNMGTGNNMGSGTGNTSTMESGAGSSMGSHM